MNFFKAQKWFLVWMKNEIKADICQSVILLDDFFQTNFTRTHEFQPSVPLRSMAVLYLLYALPVSILSSLSSLFHWTSVPFDLKLILPRMVILLFSLSTDFFFYRLMKIFYPKFHSKQYGTMMNYYGIAHVTLVFFTRTLSNSIEAFLFLILIYLIHQNFSAIVTNRRRITLDLIVTSSLIGFICALGIFNRPTFPSFALVPILYWCITIIPTIHHSVDYHAFLGRILSLIVGAFILTASAFVLFDSYYYHDGFSFLIDLKNQLVICPLNFILYNIDSTNLDQHGLHPPWLHFLVNATILYGPLHLMAMFYGLKQIILTKGKLTVVFNWREFFSFCRTIDFTCTILSLFHSLHPSINISTSRSSISSSVTISVNSLCRPPFNKTRSSSFHLSSLADIQHPSCHSLWSSASSGSAPCITLCA